MSVLTNAHNQIRVAEYQRCGTFNNPDMLTVGMGGLHQGQYRAEVFLWAILGAPLILGNDIRKTDNFTLDLVTNPGVLAIDQDPQCIQGSLARAIGATETWIKPLHDGTFAVVLLNKAEDKQNATLYISRDYNWGDFYPAFLDEVCQVTITNSLGWDSPDSSWPTRWLDDAPARETPLLLGCLINDRQYFFIR